MNDGSEIPEVQPELEKLNYEAPRDRLLRDPSATGGRVLLSVLAMMVGGAVAVGCTAFASAFIFMAAESSTLSLRRILALAYFGLVLVAGNSVHAPWRKGSRTPGRWFGFGFLIGLGLTLLLEGVCFAVAPR